VSRKASKTKAQKAKEKQTLVIRARFSDTEQAFEIDLHDLTSEEEILIEEHFDRPLSLLDAEGWVTASAKGRVFVSYLARRRKEADFSYDQALEYDPRMVERTDEEEAERPTDAPKRTGSQS
jgi:hypothetical protein